MLPNRLLCRSVDAGRSWKASIKSFRRLSSKNTQDKDGGNIVTFHKLRKDLYNEFHNVRSLVGVGWQRFPRLTALLKGHRRGELSLLCGATGSGKTTLMAELSLDLAIQGVKTLWGSFEIKNVRLAKTMLKQFSGLNLEQHVSEYDVWADQFEQLPLYFMGFHGQVDVSNVIKTMSDAVERHAVRHIVVDNLQFMLGSKSTHLADCYTAQNHAIAEFRKFASHRDVHISLVVHPRKEAENSVLSNSSIFGTAKASQEADNILILQSPSGKPKSLQVTKNRFDGDIGQFPLTWHKDTCTLSGHFSHAHQHSSHTHLDLPSFPMDSIPFADVFVESSVGLPLSGPKPGPVIPSAAAIAAKPNQSAKSILRATSLSSKVGKPSSVG